MNKLIEELALLCYEECGDYHIGSNSQFNHQKFAELIVKKCISMADEFEMDVNRSGLVDKMKEYFGVEE